MAEEFDPFASGQATRVEAEPAFDPFASGQAVLVAPQEEEAFDPFAAGRATAIEDTSMVDRLEGRLSPERQLPADSLQRVEAARIKAIEDAPEPTLLVRLKENIKSGWSNTTIGSLLESIQEPLANEPLELRTQRATVDRLAREKARRGGADVLSDPSLVEYPDKVLDSEIEKQGKRLLAQIEKSAPETKARIADREAALTETAQRIGSYQGLPDYQGPIEGLASLGGQIVGSIADPANIIGGPEVRLASNASRLGRVANQFLSQGAGGALGNLAVEPVSQANRIRTGELDKFSHADAAKGAALGFMAGGALGAIHAAVSRSMPEPKAPSLVTQMDSTSNGTPAAANAAANEIAMQAPPGVPPTRSAESTPLTPDTAAPKVDEAAPAAQDNLLDLAMTPTRVEKMTDEEFMAHYQKPENSITNDAVLVGQKLTDKDQIADLKVVNERLRKQSKDLIDEGKYDEAAAVGYKAQFFNEAYEVATKTGGFKDGGVNLELARDINAREASAQAPKIEEPSVGAREYLDELLATNEITQAEHKARVAELKTQEKVKRLRTEKEIIEDQQKRWSEIEAEREASNKASGADSLTKGVQDAAEYRETSSISEADTPAALKHIENSPAWKDINELGKWEASYDEYPFNVKLAVLKDSNGKRVGELRYSNLSDEFYFSGYASQTTPVMEKHRIPGPKGKIAAHYDYLFSPKDAGIGSQKHEPAVNARAMDDPEIARLQKELEEVKAANASSIDASPRLALPAAMPTVASAPELILPKELAKSNPRYKTSEVVFENPLDKALYIIAQDAKRSARDADFLKLVMDATGMDEQAARAAGKVVRDRIRVLSNNAKEGQKLTLKASAPKQQAPAPVATQAASQPVAQPTPVPAQAAVTPPAPPAPPAQAGGAAGSVPPGQVPAPNPAFNNPIPNHGWTPFISKTKIGKLIKEKMGTIAGNIRAIDPEVFGALTERGYTINELKFDWHNMSKGYGKIRKLLKPEAFTELDRLLQSGLHDEAATFIRGSRHEAAITQYIADFKKTLDALRRAEINAGREVGLIDNYWIRQVADYEGLRKALGRDPSNAVERAIKAAEAQKKRGLTAQEEQQVINDLISTSFSGKGKPGFLNARTIDEIQKDWFKHYEPSDVAIEQRINRVATDVVDRAYFGKFEPAGLSHAQSGNVGAIEGSFGEIIRRHLNDGSLSPEGSRVVVRNLQDFLRSESGFNENTSELAAKIRKAQTYGYLSDISSAIPQYSDFFLTAWRSGFDDAAKGYVNRPIKLDDIKLHQGTPETEIYSKRNREGFVGSVFRNAVQTSIGISDGFNKGGSINASFHEAARDINNPNSETYKRLDRKWSERYPNRWPAIKKDLQSKDFQNAKLNPNTRFFLWAELADLQPISGESRAQGYHQAGFFRILYTLRSHAVKQLDVMRETGYEKMRSRDASVRAEGRKNLVTYALIVGIGSQFLSSYARDELFNRDSSASDYALSGLFQLVGLNRYLIYRSGDVGAGTASLETLVPGVGILNDLGQSLGVGLQYATNQRSTKTGLKTVPDIPTALSKMKAIKYVPFIGRGLDAYLGPGAATQRKKDEDKANGKPQKSTIKQIGEAIVPPDTKS